MATEASGFEIAGEVYEVPRLETFDMDEAQVLYDLSGIVMEDFKPPHPDADELEQAAVWRLQLVRTRTPAFRRALVHIAYRRKHADYDFSVLDEIIGKLNAADVAIAIELANEQADEEAAENDPLGTPNSPKSPDGRSNGSGTSEPSNGGSPSPSDSVGQVVSLARTTTSALGTSSPASSPATPASAS